MCGHTLTVSRLRKGLLVVCKDSRCGYTLYAGLPDPCSVTARTPSKLHDCIWAGWLSLIPYAWYNKAKAAQV